VRLDGTSSRHGCTRHQRYIRPRPCDRGRYCRSAREPTRADYDGLGRIVAITPAEPLSGGRHCRFYPAYQQRSFDYFLPQDWTTKPYSIAHIMVQDGRDHDEAAYQESWIYTDGLGRGIVTLKEAESDGKWVVHGLNDYDTKGAVRRAYLSRFFQGPPDQFSPECPSRDPVWKSAVRCFPGRTDRDVQPRRIDITTICLSCAERRKVGCRGPDARSSSRDVRQRSERWTRSPALLSEREHVGNKVQEYQTIRELLANW